MENIFTIISFTYTIGCFITYHIVSSRIEKTGAIFNDNFKETESIIYTIFWPLFWLFIFAAIGWIYAGNVIKSAQERTKNIVNGVKNEWKVSKK